MIDDILQTHHGADALAGDVEQFLDAAQADDVGARVQAVLVIRQQIRTAGDEIKIAVASLGNGDGFAYGCGLVIFKAREDHWSLLRSYGRCKILVT